MLTSFVVIKAGALELGASEFVNFEGAEAIDKFNIAKAGAKASLIKFNVAGAINSFAPT